jgi:uncharacterized protein (DUF58 family)
MAANRPSRRYHIHWPGIFAVGLTMFVGIGAINSQNNLMFIVVGVALSLIAISGVISGAMLLRLRVARSHIPMVHAGSPGAIDYAVTNASRFLPAFALLIREVPPARATRPRTRHRGAEPAPRLLPSAVTIVPTRSAIRARARTEPRPRGIVPLTAIEVSSSFPLGVFRKSVRFADRGELIIAPAVRPVAPSEIATLRTGRRGTELPRTRSGQGLDFFGLRDYVSGDSPKSLAWKAWARTDQMVVHETTDEQATAVRLVLAVDAADGPDACEHAISECASVALAASDAGIDVEVSVAGHDIHHILRGPRGRTDLLRALARLEVTRAAGAGQSPRHTHRQIVIASGPRGRAMAPAGRVWGMAR